MSVYYALEQFVNDLKNFVAHYLGDLESSKLIEEADYIFIRYKGIKDRSEQVALVKSNVLDDLKNLLTQLTAEDSSHSSRKKSAHLKELKDRFEDLQQYSATLVKRADTSSKPYFSLWDNFLPSLTCSISRHTSYIVTPYMQGKMGMESEDIVQLFAALRKNRFVTALVLNFYDKDLNRLAIEEVLDCPNIESLHLEHYSDSLALKGSKTLTKLSIKDHSFNNEALITLAANFPQLTSIDIESDNISVEGLLALCKTTSIKEVRLKADTLRDETLFEIVSALQGSHIEKLSLESDAITNRGLECLALVTSLSTLTVKSKSIENDAQKLFEQNNCLNALNLEGAQMQNPGFQYFAANSDKHHPNKTFMKQYLLALEDHLFVKKSVYFSEFILGDKELSEKLNEAAVNTQTQAYQRSCAARSIMLLLNKFDLIPDEQVNRSKELEIYSQIWTGVGQVADFSLMLSYLRRYNLETQVLEDTTYSSQYLKNPLVESTYNSIFGDSEKAISKIVIELVDILNKDPDENAYFLLVTLPGSNDDSEDLGHGVLLAREGKAYYLYNPAESDNIVSNDIEELQKNLDELKYAGIAIAVNSPTPQLLQAPKRGGFFTPAQSKRLGEKDNERQCVLQ